MKMSFQIEGAKELESKLRTLPARLEKKVIRSAVRKGQKPMQLIAKSNARSLVGGAMGSLLAKNLIIRTAKKQKSGSYSINVMMRPGVGEFSPPPTKAGKKHYIPAAIEFGHMAGDTFVPPIPFMRSSAEATVAERMRVFTEQLRIGLLREAIKAR